MFNIEQAIAEWRKQMRSAGIKESKTLDELESHLREEIERQLKIGIAEDDAIRFAIQKIGSASWLSSEFKKADKSNQRKVMKRNIMISAGVIGVLVGMAIVMPAIAQYRHNGAMVPSEIVLLLLGVVLTVGSAGAAIAGMKKRRA